MKIFFKFLMITCFLAMSNVVKAHQPEISSTMLIEQSPGQWLVQLRSALTAFEYEVKYHFGNDAYDSPEAFEALVLEHVKKNLFIKINDQELETKTGHVKLGHETSVVYELSEAPNIIETIIVSNTSFADIHRNKSALIIHKKDVTPEQFELNYAYNYSASLSFDQSKFSRTDIQETNPNLASVSDMPSRSSKRTVIALVAIVLLILIGAFVLRRKSWSSIKY